MISYPYEPIITVSCSIVAAIRPHCTTRPLASGGSSEPPRLVSPESRDYAFKALFFSFTRGKRWRMKTSCLLYIRWTLTPLLKGPSGRDSPKTRIPPDPNEILPCESQKFLTHPQQHKLSATLKEQFTQTKIFRHGLLTSMIMESQWFSEHLRMLERHSLFGVIHFFWKPIVDLKYVIYIAKPTVKISAQKRCKWHLVFSLGSRVWWRPD